MIGRQLPTPNDTRWNAEYDCLSVILEQDEKKLKSLLRSLNLSPVTSQEIAFLKEYLVMLKPIAICLDILQGEKQCYLGCVLPVLVKLKAKMSDQVSNGTKPIREFLIKKIEERFQEVFSNLSYAIASAVHPSFKLKWMSDDATKVVLKSKILNLMGNSQLSYTKPITPVDSEQFLTFEETISQDSEYEKFLNDPRNTIEMLFDYPGVLKLFVKFNTPIPSSAPVERLFSVGALVLTGKRNKLNDVLFERLLLLKVNGM